MTDKAPPDAPSEATRAGAGDHLASLFERLAKHKSGDTLAWTPDYSKWRMLKDLDLALGEIMRLRASVSAPPAETEQPVDVTGQGRLLLNAYGRACYMAGQVNALKLSASASADPKEPHD